MPRRRIACASCTRRWASGELSLYERQAVESRPCPYCGAYTLRCQEVPQPKMVWKGLSRLRLSVRALPRER